MTQHLTGKESGYHCGRSDTLYAGRALCRERRQKLFFFKAHPWLQSEEELQWRRSWSQEVGEEAWPKEPAEERARAGQLGQGREDLEGSGVGVRSREEQRGGSNLRMGPITLMRNWTPLYWERETKRSTGYWLLSTGHQACFNHSQGRHCHKHHPHLRDEEMEAQRGKPTCSRSDCHVVKRDLNPGNLTYNAWIFY